MDRSEAIKILGHMFQQRGLGRGPRQYRRDHNQIFWRVDLELVPKTDRVGVKVGVCPKDLLPEGVPIKANDCPIIFHPDSSDEPFGIERWRAWTALDMSSTLGDEDRADELAAVALAIADLIEEVATLADLQKIAEEGRVRGFVRRDARELLMLGHPSTLHARD